MTNQDRQSAGFPRGEPVVQSRRRVNLAAAHRGERHGDDGRYLAAYRRLLARHQRLIRRIGIASAALIALIVLGCAGLWWRLASGPIQLDIFTPWLVSAIEENFGSHERVEVGGTQIERTQNGGAAVRVRDIVVRDPDGTVVASAPKAEIHVSGLSLLSGHMRAESLNLVGAAMAVRIEPDGSVTVFASGADKRPIATATGPAPVATLASPQTVKHDRVEPENGASQTPHASPQARLGLRRPASAGIAALVAWLDGIGQSGLDGHDLRELGLKNGALTVDDARTGKRWTFHDISLSIERPHGGGIVATIGSNASERPWGVTASIKPSGDGFRTVALEARQVSVNDLLLASRLGDGSLQIDVPLSASLRGEIGPDGMPQTLTGRIVAEAGYINDGDSADGRLDFDRAEFKINWDAGSRVLTLPFQILSGGDRMTLLGQVQAPAQSGGPWQFRIGGGTVVLNGAGEGAPLVLNQIAVNGQFDPAAKRFSIGRSEIGNGNVGVAMSGSADYSSGELRLAAGLAATRMSADDLKRLWPVFVVPKVRDWFNEHLIGGNVQRVVIGVNAPLNTLRADGPPIPDDGLTLDASATDCVLSPVAGLPVLRDADLTVHIVGRDAQIAVGKATADLPSGRKLVLSSGLFEVPDTAPHEPPARVHFKIDGAVASAVELLEMDRLRGITSVPFDPATTHGAMSAMVALALPLKPDLPPGSTNYAVTVDATNFSADRMIMGQKVEAADLKVSANNQGYVLKGNVKIGGTPASLEYRQAHGDSEADVHIQGMLDQTMRTNLSLDPSNTIAGAIPIDITGRVSSASERDGSFSVTADLTPAQIDGFLPGWVKPAGKPARATFVLTTKPQSIHVDDLLIEGAGGGVKGTVALDGSGALQSADFPSYGFSDGDRTSLKVTRAADGVLHVVMRGDAYDGRAFVKAMTGGPDASTSAKREPPDIDLDMKLGAVLGFNGEALRGLELKLSRRAGEIRSLGLTAHIGRDATLSAELRGQAGGRRSVDIESGDAGALFRFTDVYSRMTGGELTTVMDPPSANNSVQLGSVTVRNFAVHDESQLEHAVSNGSPLPRNNMPFSSLKVDFVRSPGRIALHDGVVRGPVLGGTIDGIIDYAADDVHLRGTLIPLYGPNNLLGQLPVVGLFLGGEKEGLVGVTYEVIGKPNNPVLRVNPLSALAPGLLRKVFEFPAAGAPAAPAAADNTGTVDDPTNGNH